MPKKKARDDDPNLRAFGRAVQEMRREIGMTQEDLASKAGIHRTYLSDVERGQRNLGLQNIVAIAHGLRVYPYHLMKRVTWVGDYRTYEMLKKKHGYKIE